MFAPSDFNFDLPPELIAQEPAPERDASRLLHVAADGLHDRVFRDIVELLPADAVVIANDTRVIPARLLGKKATGGGVELLLLEPEPETPAPDGTTAWRCLARARRPLRVGQEIFVDDATALVLLRERAEDGSVVLAVPGDVYALLDRLGRVPLPRYIHREQDAPARPEEPKARTAPARPEEPKARTRVTVDDRDRYQTMFAKVPGAVAAPTAGFHMTPPITDRLRARGIAIATVTLHVGYGTFEPVRVDDIRHHKMHAERYAIPEDTAALVASGRPLVALGTTALRALEASRGKAGSGTTNLFIYPGSHHEFLVHHLITNFHLPESTLLMLVCAFAGTDRVLAAYRHAVEQRYRFFSYGDAMLISRQP